MTTAAHASFSSFHGVVSDSFPAFTGFCRMADSARPMSLYVILNLTLFSSIKTELFLFAIFLNLGFGEPDRYHVPDMWRSFVLLC
jgi:hypothetical protein